MADFSAGSIRPPTTSPTATWAFSIAISSRASSATWALKASVARIICAASGSDPALAVYCPFQTSNNAFDKSFASLSTAASAFVIMSAMASALFFCKRSASSASVRNRDGAVAAARFNTAAAASYWASRNSDAAIASSGARPFSERKAATAPRNAAAASSPDSTSGSFSAAAASPAGSDGAAAAPLSPVAALGTTLFWSFASKAPSAAAEASACCAQSFGLLWRGFMRGGGAAAADWPCTAAASPSIETASTSTAFTAAANRKHAVTRIITRCAGWVSLQTTIRGFRIAVITGNWVRRCPACAVLQLFWASAEKNGASVLKHTRIGFYRPPV